jgi:hypothetical protein
MVLNPTLQQYFSYIVAVSFIAGGYPITVNSLLCVTVGGKHFPIVSLNTLFPCDNHNI